MSYQNVIPAQLVLQALPTSITTLYSVPSNARTFVKDINICNTTASPITVNLYFVPVSGTYGASNAFLLSYSIAANSTYHWVGSQILLSSQTIQGYASATGCAIIIGGGEAS